MEIRKDKFLDGKVPGRRGLALRKVDLPIPDAVHDDILHHFLIPFLIKVVVVIP